MRILMLSHGYPPTVSGVTLVVQKLSRALAQSGHSVTVLTASEHREAYRDEDKGVQLIRIRSQSNPFWKEGPIPFIDRKGLQQIVNEVRPDIIHTHENAVLSWQLLRLNLKGKIPLISSCYYLPRYVTHYVAWGPLERLIQAAIWKYAVHNLNQFDHVVFSTATQQQDYIQHGLRVATTAISNGVDMSRYHPINGKVENFEIRYRLPPRPRIIFVGRLMKDKKIDVLIQAMAKICAEREAHLLIVGRGDDRPQLEAMIRNFGVEPFVHLLGFVPEQDLPGLYRASDIFAIASICEVQSIPAIQAAVTALPIVAVSAAALPELVHHGENGFLVPPDSTSELAEAILSILRDPNHAYQMGQASLAIGKHHSELETFKSYEKLYERVLSG